MMSVVHDLGDALGASGRRTRRRAAVAAMLLVAYQLPALAGFVDERKFAPKPQVPAQAASAPRAAAPAAAPSAAAAASAAAAPAPALVGFGSNWEGPLISAATRLPLRAALNILRPNPERLEISMPEDLQRIAVTWKPSDTRLDVLRGLNKDHQLTFKLEGASLTVARDEVAAQQARKSLRQFEVRLGDVRLHVAMQRWAAESGARLRWDADKHVLISAPMVFETTDVLNAIGMALSTPGIANSSHPLEVCEYPNVPRLLRITRQGEQAKDCPN